MTRQVKAISTYWDGIVNEITSEVGVSSARPVNSTADHKKNDIHKFKAIWDTGATHSVITKSIVEKLGIKPITKIEVGVVGGVREADVYMVNFYFPNNLGFSFAKVTEGDLVGDSDILIGMDVISFGDFAVSNFKNKTMFSFRAPSMEAIDFVSEINSKNKSYLKKSRNLPCYCGSGKKTKNCHGKVA